MDKKAENKLIFAWLISLVATLGSLYFSQIKQFEPCTLCWYQRIFMYPIVLILFLGIIKKDTKVSLYTIVFSGIGLCISAYHYGIQKLALLASSAPSCGQISCTGEYINWLGFITIPFLAGTAFLFIFICSLSVYRNEERK